MSEEDSFTDARDLCNSTSDNLELDERSLAQSDRINEKSLVDTPSHGEKSPDFPKHGQNKNFGALNIGKVTE
jgi:hypothetical protein